MKKCVVFAAFVGLNLGSTIALAADIPVATEHGPTGQAQVGVGLNEHGIPSGISVSGSSGNASAGVRAESNGALSASGGVRSGNTTVSGGVSHNAATGATSVNGGVSISIP